MSTVKKKKRDSEKYPALNPRLNSKTKQSYIDYDYVDKLSEKDKDWLNRFSGEYYSGNFKKEVGSVRGDGKYLSDAIHSTDAATRKDCYDRNNWNNADFMSVAKAKGEAMLTEKLEEIVDDNTYAELNDFETVMIHLLDIKKTS